MQNTARPAKILPAAPEEKQLPSTTPEENIPVAQPETPTSKALRSTELQAQIKALQEQKREVAEIERKERQAIPRGRGIMDAIKKAVNEDPALKGDDLLDHLIALGIKTTRPSVDTMRSDFLHSMRVLKRLGALTDEAGKKVP